jgi:hypothetical protein
VRAIARCNPPKRLLTLFGKFQRFSRSRKVLPVALVPPVVGVSPGVDVLAVLRVAAVSPVLAMRWFSFVQ